jgi:hypothetical protein
MSQLELVECVREDPAIYRRYSPLDDLLFFWPCRRQASLKAFWMVARAREQIRADYSSEQVIDQSACATANWIMAYEISGQSRRGVLV